MRRTLTGIAVTGLLLGSTVWAQDQTDQAAVPTTATTEAAVTQGALSKEGVGIQPEAGAINFTGAGGGNETRGVLGLNIDWNVTRMLTPNPNVYIGPQTGLVYSHLGSATSNFLGYSPTTVQNGIGANILLFPVNLKAGYNVTDNFRVSAHGGGNVLYRSVANSMLLGASSFNSGNGSNWSMFPNLGGDIEFGLGKSASILIRPDETFTPGSDFFTGTVGLGLALG